MGPDSRGYMAGNPKTVGRLRALINATHTRAVRLLAVVRHLAAINRVRRRTLARLTRPTTRRVDLFGLDWAWGHLDPGALRAHGARFACRYLSRDQSKNLTPREARQLAAAGIGRVVVWETAANRAGQGRAAGWSDAQEADRQAKACGKPDSRPVYFAIDFDAAGPDIHQYFRGVNDYFGGRARVGAYGGLRAIRFLFDHGLITFGWQTYAWSGGRWDKRAQLQQYSNGHRVAGVDCDYDRSTAQDFGQW